MARTSSPALRAAVALAFSALAVPPARAADSDVLKKQTVQIRVNREGAETEHGSGVVLCQKDGLAYILSAHHVLYGKTQSGGLKLSRRDVQTTEIRFFKDLAPAITEDRDKGEDRITPFPVPAKDLVLLVVTVLDQVPTAAPGPLPTETDLNAQKDRNPFSVTAIGYARRSAQSWSERKGELLRRDPPFLMHSAQIEEGFSGGPLFDESGALVGLNVQFASAAAGGEDTYGSREGRTLAIDEILKSIDAWVPAGCIEGTAEDTSESEAFDLYKLAMREISLQRWGKSVPLLRSALEKKPREGGRVHLQGMRYTEYLPHYHLGLAYYKLNLYRAAYRELAISQNQGVIQDDKRHRRLKKIKKDAYEKRNEEPAPAAP